MFGTLKNLEASLTVDLLSLAQPLAGSEPQSLVPPLHWQFWPRWETCEPDIVVEDDRNLCVIEAKLYSEFGEDMGAGSQLRREWSDGLRRSREMGKELWLVTLTNHGSVPEEAIRRQLVRTTADLSRVRWLSWLEIGRFLRGLNNEAAGSWSKDLLELLSRMGLAPFDGFGEITARALATRSVMSWRLASGVDVANVGFGPTLTAARRWRQKGGDQWRPRLT